MPLLLSAVVGYSVLWLKGNPNKCYHLQRHWLGNDNCHKAAAGRRCSGSCSFLIPPTRPDLSRLLHALSFPTRVAQLLGESGLARPTSLNRRDVNARFQRQMSNNRLIIALLKPSDLTQGPPRFKLNPPSSNHSPLRSQKIGRRQLRWYVWYERIAIFVWWVTRLCQFWNSLLHTYAAQYSMSKEFDGIGGRFIVRMNTALYSRSATILLQDS